MPPKELPDGLYDLLVDRDLAEKIKPLLADGIADVRSLKPAERRDRLAVALAELLAQLIDENHLSQADSEQPDRLTILIDDVLTIAYRQLGKSDYQPRWPVPVQVLHSIHRRGTSPIRPRSGLLGPWLFTAGRSDPALLSELRAELGSADRVDILMSFITWSGVRRLLDVFESATAIGADGKPRIQFRIITTTYIGATEFTAVEKLAEMPGIEIRISLDGRRTRLHAKAWVFHRATGFGTAFVGSANMTGAALIGGLEWTVKFTQAGQPDLFSAAIAHFETLWNDPEFEYFDPREPVHRTRLQIALNQEAGKGQMTATPVTTWFDLHPKSYQQEMLARLATERRHGRMRNLVVAATGTGKTMVAAFDYQRITKEYGGLPRLLFVAHRIEILKQARATFCQVLRNSHFGELLADGYEPKDYSHLFTTIQTVTARRLLDRVGVDYWHTVIIDECHHLPATSFDDFARRIRSTVLLGLTATPERADGESIMGYFDTRPDGSPAVELRLWDALDQQLLAPFEYFGTSDDTDLSMVDWDRRDLEQRQLDQLLSANVTRARLVIDTFLHYCGTIESIRALAFCVSVAHAEFMADQFRCRGLRAEAVTSHTLTERRAQIPALLAKGDLQIICTCDLYNEGVDIPEINTLLLLRPTQSPVLFLQQLGRGLRLTAEKTLCLVLDFVGRYRSDFRFDRLLQAMTGIPRAQLITEVEQGFSSLPPGCHIRFDRVAREQVLATLRTTIGQNWSRLRKELLAYAAVKGSRNFGLADFVCEQGIELEDLYQSQGSSGWTALRRSVGFETRATDPEEAYLGRRFNALLHVDDPVCLDVWKRLTERGMEALLEMNSADRRRVQMLAYQIFSNFSDTLSPEQFVQRLVANPLISEELTDLVSLLDEWTLLEPQPVPGFPSDWPLILHGSYEVREILTAVGWLTAESRSPFQAGVLALTDHRIELLFVTLDKRDGFHERIAYHDYAISPEHFHWQTQNSAGPDTMAGRRYLESPENGWSFQLFVREDKNHPYRALGPVQLANAEGNRPMSITWRLEVLLPVELFRRYSVLRAA